MNAQWVRVSKRHPCSVCSKPDWCDYSPDLNLVLCMRVESDRPSRNAMGGWLHPIDPFAPIVSYTPARKAIQDSPLDCEAIWTEWFYRTNDTHLVPFAESLNVSAVSLRDLGCVWNGQAWAFPMKDAQGKMIGIRLRSTSGEKWAVKGSKQGLFYSASKPETCLFVVEGPTDAAAGISIGLSVLGRPACMGCEQMIDAYIRGHRIKSAVLVTDNDDAGRRGAKRLQGSLSVPSCLWLPPVKDLREFVRLGGDAESIQFSVKNLVWSQPV